MPQSFNYAVRNPKLFEKITQHKLCDEQGIVTSLIEQAALSEKAQTEIAKRAEVYVKNVRDKRLKKGSALDSFMAEYDLSSIEGVALMCLAEALLRIPDKHTADKLIRDKICGGDWQAHLSKDGSIFVNGATWSLILLGKLWKTPEEAEAELTQTFKKFVTRSTNATVRTAVRKAMQILGKQFVMGETIDSAVKRAKDLEKLGYRYSYDMLGEAAKTNEDALNYYASYEKAIHAIGKAAKDRGVYESPGISIKLTALLPRYEAAQSEQVFSTLFDRTLELAKLAKQYDIGLTIDAEEADRLEISLALLEKLAYADELADWNGLGLAVQAYQKRATFVLDWLIDLAKASKKRFKVRLVKGAYWDSEIKHAQVEGRENYPVFTRKVYTDVSYIVCIKKLLDNRDSLYPQFATHNAHSLATVLTLAEQGGMKLKGDFEFQCLHGMGTVLYDQIVDSKKGPGIACRIYAPVGAHEQLLAYLVRRLLENGANSSFVNRIVDAEIPIAQLVQDPVEIARKHQGLPHPQIPLPRDIYIDWQNSNGVDLTDTDKLNALQDQMAKVYAQKHHVQPLIAGLKKPSNQPKNMVTPANHDEALGTLVEATEKEVAHALDAAAAAFDKWDQTSVIERAACLDKLAELMEKHMPRLMAIAIKEAGKSIPNAVAEVREAIDFCRYYADQARKQFGAAMLLPGPTGESNRMQFSGKGIFVCISPWNFPLAIFTGEVTAALVSGNVVLAKPAAQTALIASEAVKLMHEAGIPQDVVQLVPGSGRTIGTQLTEDPRVAGVIFTGSTNTAKQIQKVLTEKSGAIPTFVAETGGQNCMLVDSSALPEQVVTDVVRSAFDSAGQRCSALRVLFLQEDIADNVIKMIKGAMDELIVGDPSLLSTDVGPVIDAGAQKTLLAHIDQLKRKGYLLHQVKLDKTCDNGTFVAPTMFEIPGLSTLTQEVFGPVLHVIRFKAKHLDKTIDEINSSGFGLTFGIHSRIESTIQYVVSRVKVGNIYVNRDMVGAVVGVQPFGGQGLSGTGPKAGGHLYLPRLANERVVSINTTASGGNATLMTLEQD